jgi:hypothetical protein
MKKCNSMTSVRKLAEKLDSLVETVGVALVATAPTNDVHVLDNVGVDDIVVDVATAPTNANIDACGMSRLLLLLFFYNFVSNDSVVGMVLGLPDGFNDNRVDYCGTYVDAINSNANVEAATTSTTAYGTSPATISDASVVGADTVVISGAIAIVAASTDVDMSQEVIGGMADDVVVDDIVVVVATAPTKANIDATCMSRLLLRLLMFCIISFF